MEFYIISSTIGYINIRLTYAQTQVTIYHSHIDTWSFENWHQNGTAGNLSAFH